MEIMKHSKLLNKTKFICIVLFLVSYLNGSSQDLRSGYLQVNWLNGYTYSGTVYLLTDNAINISRPFIRVNWGVIVDTLFLVDETPVSTGILKKYYGTATYPGPSTNQITFIDSFRIPSIKNIAQSDLQSFKLKSILKISTFQSPNSSPVMQNSEIRLIAQNDKAIFDPKFHDNENDSLSFQLVPCAAANYRNPNGVAVSPSGVVSFSRDSIGSYAFSYIVTEWRKDSGLNYQNIGSTQADFVMDITTNVSVEEHSKKRQISLFPNPTNSIINLDVSEDDLKGAKLSITNAIGQNISLSINNKQIDLSKAESGLYFISIKFSDGTQSTAKFLKL